MADAKQTSAEKQTAAKRYGDLKSNRKEAETRAKRCAKVTLPRLWVDEGAKSRTPRFRLHRHRPEVRQRLGLEDRAGLAPAERLCVQARA